MSLVLNVLCQAPVPEGRTPVDSVRDTVALARCAEEAGYTRFWVAEHHSDRALACGSPEILVAHVAATTSRLVVGSGGVLLPYHAPFKVAEQFGMLAALHPGRIDLGVGRGGGSEGHAPEALGVRNRDPFAAFDELLRWLGPPTGRPWADTFASPDGAPPPTPWVLGTSPASGTFAGERGLPYAFGGFLDPRAVVASLTAYHTAFRPSRWADRPRVNLAWYVQAADTEADARHQARSSEQWFVETLLRGRNPRFPDPAHVDEAGWSPMERAAVAMRRELALVGTPAQVVAGLERLGRQLAVDELTLVTIAHDPEARLASYRGIAAAAGL